MDPSDRFHSDYSDTFCHFLLVCLLEHALLLHILDDAIILLIQLICQDVYKRQHMPERFR